MPMTVTLLRPFTFSRAARGRGGLPTEQKFTPKLDNKTKEWIPTEVELPDDMLEHPFIKEDWADGCIERPEVTAARVKAAQEQRAKQEEADAKELKRAQEAFQRATGAHQVHKTAAAATDDQLNTPVNKLGAARGKDIDESALADALNTPANELAGGNVTSSKKSAA